MTKDQLDASAVLTPGDYFLLYRMNKVGRRAIIGVVIKLLTLPGIELHFLGCPNSSLVTVPTELSWGGVVGKVDLSMRRFL